MGHCVAVESLPKLSTFNGQQVSLMIWSFATARIVDPVFTDALAHHALNVVGVHAMSIFSLSTMTWSLAHTQCESGTADALLAALGREAVSQHRRQFFSAQMVTNIVWAFARIKHSDALGIVSELSCVVPSLVNEFTSQHLSNFVWATATVRWKDPALLAVLASRATQHIDQFTEGGMTNIMWAFAQLHAVDAPSDVSHMDAMEDCGGWTLFQSASKHLAKVGVESLPPRSVGSYLRAFAICGMYPTGVFWQLLLSSHRQFYKASGQVWYAALGYMLEHLAGDFESRRLDLLESLPHLRAMEQQFTHRTSSILSSRAHADVSGQLNVLGLRHTNEYQVWGILVDIAIPQHKLMLEIDGATHYVHTPGGDVTLDGASRYKDRLLNCLGWQVIRVPVQKWRNLGDHVDKRRYLSEKLRSKGLEVGF